MDIIPMVYEGVKLIGSEKPLKIGEYHPSSLMGCLRKQYYQYVYHLPYDFETQEVFAQGNAYHALIQKALTLYCKKHPDLKIQNEPEDVDRIYKKDGIELHGRMDCFLKTKAGKLVILEIKSINDIRYAPKEVAIYQLNSYLQHYQEAEGILLYINKAKQNGNLDYAKMREFKYTYDEGLFNILFKRALNFDDDLKHKRLPAPEAYIRGGTTDWECRQCPKDIKYKCYKQIMETQIGKLEFEEIERCLNR